MGNFINKTFRKNDSIRAVINYQDRRVKTYWLIPKSNKVSVNKETFMINDKDFVLFKGIPTYYYVSGTPEPMNLYKQPMNTLMTAQDFNVALNAHVAEEIFKAQGGGLGEMLPVFIGFITIVAVALVWYTLSNELSSLRDLINQLQESINTTNGGF